MHWIAFIFLLLSGTLLCYQDLKARLISLWAIVVFALTNALFYLHNNLFSSLVENSLFCLGYMLLLYLVLLLYFFVRKRTFIKIMDSQFGWGDALILIAIGICLDPVSMIYFFSAALAVSLLLSLLFFRRAQSIPLAGLLVVNYLVFLIVQISW